MFFFVITVISTFAISPLRPAEDKDDKAPEGMVLIPAGEFERGSNHFRDNEKPIHKVYVDAFYMDIHEVTVGEYNRFVKETRHRPLPPWVSKYSPTDKHPAVCVSWHDAMAFAKWTGKRLPTEAEWERAARGGLKGKYYPWGDAAPDGTQCNFSDINSGRENADKTVDDGYQWNAPVGSYPPNAYGLYDMTGNVWEWCLDAYDADYYLDCYYSDSPLKNPVLGTTVVDWLENNLILPRKDVLLSANDIDWVIANASTIHSKRVLRGGSRACTVEVIRVSHRNSNVPTTTYYNDFGFRCVKDIKPKLQ